MLCCQLTILGLYYVRASSQKPIAYGGRSWRSKIPYCMLILLVLQNYKHTFVSEVIAVYGIQTSSTLKILAMMEAT